MDIFRKIAERKIEEAIARGEFDHLPLRGQPIPDDEAGIPEEERVAYRLLKNAHILPEEVQLLKEIAELRQALGAAATSAEKRKQIIARLNSREAQYNILMERRRLRQPLR